MRRTRTQGPLNVGGYGDQNDLKSKFPDMAASQYLASFLECTVRDRSQSSADYFRTLLPRVADKIGFSQRRTTTSGSYTHLPPAFPLAMLRTHHDPKD